jgi:hypothetical protein
VAIRLDLEEREAEYLRDILDWWIEDAGAASLTIESDPSISTVEELTIMSHGSTVILRDAINIRRKLWEGMNCESASTG